MSLGFRSCTGRASTLRYFSNAFLAAIENVEKEGRDLEKMNKRREGFLKGSGKV
ncbi:hypothetical protein KY289_020057 [Solanum tuberosum]|nr:hypothetical protein KY289_020057 [Solanum tuberosum]